MITPEIHKLFGSDTNNRAWKLIEKPMLAEAEESELLQTAMASGYHWGQVGTARQIARSQLLMATALAKLEWRERALPYALDAMRVLTDSESADWERAFAHAAVAWAYYFIGNVDAYRANYDLARQIGEHLRDPEDREIFLATFTVIPVP